MSLLSSEKAFQLLNFQFESKLFSAKARNVVSSQTKEIVHSASVVMQRVQENCAGSGKPPAGADLAAVATSFIDLAPHGIDGLKQRFFRHRDVKHLAWALSYKDEACPKSIMESPYFSLALEVIGSMPQRRFLRILFDLLLSEWSQIPSGNRKLLQASLKQLLAISNDKNRFVRLLQKEHFYFLEEKGPYLLSLEILKASHEELESFLDPDHMKSSDRFTSLPFFVNSLKATSYFFEVAAYTIDAICGPYAIDKAGQTEKLNRVLPSLVKLAEKRFIGADLRRILVPIIVWIDKHPSEGASWKERIKELAMRKVGDPYIKANWGGWPGIGERQKKALDLARDILNRWISESLISLFFEKIMINNDRKEFWLPYAEKLSVRIFCNKGDLNSLREDSRIINQMGTRLSQLRGTGAVLVMTAGDYLLIEFSTGGNAFYVYKRENLGKYGLKRLEDVIENDAEESLSVFDIKKTDMPRISEVYQEEGRFFHYADWERTLALWLKTQVGV